MGLPAFLAAILALALALALAVPLPLVAATTERVVVDPQSGLAIGGYDPVAYFTDGAARLGKPQFEQRAAGVIWRFQNRGNFAAFAEYPDIYMPRFGGYDPVAVARGVSVPGHPSFWMIVSERLYLFYDAKARAAFAADPGRIIAAANRKWPDVRRSLAP